MLGVLKTNGSVPRSSKRAVASRNEPGLSMAAQSGRALAGMKHRHRGKAIRRDLDLVPGFLQGGLHDRLLNIIVLTNQYPGKACAERQVVTSAERIAAAGETFTNPVND